MVIQIWLITSKHLFNKRDYFAIFEAAPGQLFLFFQLLITQGKNSKATARSLIYIQIYNENHRRKTVY